MKSLRNSCRERARFETKLQLCRFISSLKVSTVSRRKTFASISRFTVCQNCLCNGSKSQDEEKRPQLLINKVPDGIHNTQIHRSTKSHCMYLYDSFVKEVNVSRRFTIVWKDDKYESGAINTLPTKEKRKFWKSGDLFLNIVSF